MNFADVEGVDITYVTDATKNTSRLRNRGIASYHSAHFDGLCSLIERRACNHAIQQITFDDVSVWVQDVPNERCVLFCISITTATKAATGDGDFAYILRICGVDVDVHIGVDSGVDIIRPSKPLEVDVVDLRPRVDVKVDVGVNLGIENAIDFDVAETQSPHDVAICISLVSQTVALSAAVVVSQVVR